MDASVPPEDEIINIEAIMQEIRQQILAKKDAVKTPGSTPLFVQGRRLPPAFYEHLYQAGLAHHQIGVNLHVSKSSTPLIGPLLDRVRQAAHQLVIFYVNKLATEQTGFNTHILQAVNLLAQQLEKEETSHENEAQARMNDYWPHLEPGQKTAFTANATEQDLWYCYRLLLNREPDPQGWAHFKNMIQHDGIPVQFLVNVFLDSQEFRDVQVKLQDVTLVELPHYRIYVRPSDYFIGGAIARERKYEQGVTRQIEKMLAPGAVFVDAGANIGFFTLLGAALVGPGGRVFAFEPNPDNCALMQRSVQDNQFHNVQIFQNALAEAAEAFRFSCSKIDSNGRLLHESETSETMTTIEVQAVTLDEVLPPLPRLDLIKMDIEGAEPRAWQGMSKSIARYRPALILEFSPTAIWKTSQTSPEAFLEALQEKYRLHILPNADEVSARAQSTHEIMTYAQSQPHHVDLVGYPR